MTTKRIRLTVEWDGTSSERSWARVLRDIVEESDVSRRTRVTMIELQTNYGTTPESPLHWWTKVFIWWRARSIRRLLPVK
jgi:hypothetical protein